VRGLHIILLVKSDVPVLYVRFSSGSRGLAREDAPPVLVQADDDPAALLA